MITAKLMGRMGNQAFQTATAWALARDNGDEAAFDFAHAPDGHRLKDSFFRRFNAVDFADIDVAYFHDEPSFGFTPIPYGERMALSGFFQSEKYFAHHRASLLELYELPAQALDEAASMLRTVCSDPAEVIAVHVRRGDYVSGQDVHPVLSPEYAEDAVRLLGPDRPVMVVSDDPRWCRERLARPNWWFCERDDLTELAVMTRAGACVIANSSFSWWGAWLNQSPGLQVAAPTPWFGPAGPKETDDIIPDRWQLVRWSSTPRD